MEDAHAVSRLRPCHPLCTGGRLGARIYCDVWRLMSRGGSACTGKDRAVEKLRVVTFTGKDDVSTAVEGRLPVNP